MKKPLLLGAVIGLTLLAVTPLPPTPLTLRWDFPTNKLEGITFKIYYTTNLATPKTNWTVLGTTTNLFFSTPIAPGAYFFSVTASNLWGEGDFSNVASTPPVIEAGDVKNLTIGR